MKESAPHRPNFSEEDLQFMGEALALAQKARGDTSPNPMVGAVLVSHGKIIGKGYHRRAGGPHAEIEALQDAASKKKNPLGATLYISLEPCSTYGRTPPCTDAIIHAGIKRVVAATTDPNPEHCGAGFEVLRKKGITVEVGAREEEARQANEAFNHWITHHAPLVTLKAAMTLDGKIATPDGDSKWITDEPARAVAMYLRRNSDGILIGLNTVLLDNPSLTLRPAKGVPPAPEWKQLRRFILDTEGRTPLTAQVVSDSHRKLTTLIVSDKAPPDRVAALEQQVKVWRAPVRAGRVDLDWVVHRLGQENIVSLLVEGGGETHASFLESNLAHRVAFFYAPKVIGGRMARKAVAGKGVAETIQARRLTNVEWRQAGPDLFLSAAIAS